MPISNQQAVFRGRFRPIRATLLGLTAAQAILAGSAHGGPTTLWNLDRIDQRGLPLDGRFCPDGNGSGVNVYIVSTGIDSTNIPEFGARALQFYDFAATNPCNPTGPSTDTSGRGTWLASIVGGATHGVARGVNLHSVRVAATGPWNPTALVTGLGCIDTNGASGVVLIDGVIDVLTANPADVAAVEAAVTALVTNVTKEFVVVVGAGDADVNACGNSPSREAAAITVAASNVNERLEGAWGSCVDLIAPGVGITGAWIPPGATSMVAVVDTAAAAAHVAGGVALYPDSTTGELIPNAMLANATANHLSDTMGSPNQLLYVRPGPCDPCAQPFPDDCASATIVTAGDPLMFSFAPPVPFDTQCATTDGPASCGAEKDVWFRYAAEHNGWIEIEVSPGAVQTGTSTPFDPEVAVYDLSAGCPPPFGTELTYDVGQSTTTVCGTLAPGTPMPFPVMKGCAYLIRLGGAGGATGQGDITLNRPACPPANPGGDTYRFQVNGIATGVAWNWAIRAQDGSFRTIEGVVPPGTSGGAAAVVSAFANSITAELAALGCSTMTATPEPGKPKRLLIGSASPFELWVGSTDHDVDSLATPDFECDINPPDGCIDDADADWVPDCACAMVATSGVAVIGNSCIFNPTITAVALAGTDCNANDEDDIIDIVDGTSADANENGIPDECEPDPCAADFDGSGDVGFADLTALLGAWGPCGADPCPADLDGNGDVGFTDLTALLGVWGPCS